MNRGGARVVPLSMKIGKIALWGFGVGAIALVGSMAFVNLFGCLCVDKSKRVKMEIATLTSALGSYKMDAQVYPTTDQGLEALVHKPVAPPVRGNWRPSMEKVITDPWAREYQYRQPGFHHPDIFDLWSLGPDGIESADDIGNWEQ
jgi:general secretion pathway protein G